MTEELKQKQDKKGRLLALRDYLYKYTDEQHPASIQELIDAQFVLSIESIERKRF